MKPGSVYSRNGATMPLVVPRYEPVPGVRYDRMFGSRRANRAVFEIAHAFLWLCHNYRREKQPQVLDFKARHTGDRRPVLARIEIAPEVDGLPSEMVRNNWGDVLLLCDGGFGRLAATVSWHHIHGVGFPWAQGLVSSAAAVMHAMLALAGDPDDLIEKEPSLVWDLRQPIATRWSDQATPVIPPLAHLAYVALQRELQLDHARLGEIQDPHVMSLMSLR